MIIKVTLLEVNLQLPYLVLQINIMDFQGYYYRSLSTKKLINAFTF